MFPLLVLICALHSLSLSTTLKKSLLKKITPGGGDCARS